ncbi:MAG: alpha/beta hydrolase [Rubrivivax sp.]
MQWTWRWTPAATWRARVCCRPGWGNRAPQNEARAAPMPPLIALPGTLLDARSLAPALQALALRSRTVLLGEAETLDGEVQRLAALANEPAIWLGHSLGGIVALHLAASHPGLIAGLVLLAANARASPAGGADRRQAQWQLAQTQGLKALAAAKLAPGYDLAPDDPLHTALAEQAQSVGLRRFERQLRYADRRPGLLSPRKSLHCPLLALSGAKDLLCPPLQSDEIAGLSMASRHVSLPAGGHLFPMQQPIWVATHIQNFLDQFFLARSA